ncbi:hypothetical protein ACJRO7_005216 [Eucalyptus globulus]|uniref:C2H2-type domain-containing protein n=1 Tax=Eucalyptus globulus TaxID=34317 RepID=A0ABD3J279_EUCGL
MSGHDGNSSPPAPLRAGTGQVRSSSAVPGCAGASNGGRGMNRGEYAGSSSAAIVGKTAAVFDASSGCWLCCQCRKLFPSRYAVYGHMPVHNRLSKPEKEAVSTLLELGQIKGGSSTVARGGASSSAVEAQRKKVHMELDLNKEASIDPHENYGSDDEGA